MPITKSAKKSLRVSQTKQEQNRTQEIQLEKALKKASASTVNEVISKIDKAAKGNIISKNKAARLKSRLVKKFGTPKAAAKPATAKTAPKAKPAQKKAAPAKKPAPKKTSVKK